jgi:putative tryptophan/tyrosine transport system substrate-binding protein
LAGRAQDSARIRRIGALLNGLTDDPFYQVRIDTFMQGLQEFGWIDGRNIRIEIRWSPADIELFRRYAAQLIALAPDVVLAHSSPAVAALQQETHTIPIVFIGVVDPVGAGFVSSLARPGGNATGFSALDYEMSTKWLQLLKEIVPGLTRVAVLRDSSAAGIGQLAAMQAVAPSLGLELTPIDMHDPGEIERGLNEFARGGNCGLIVTSTTSQGVYRKLIITLAAQHRLPAVHPFRFMVTEGGLISYGTDLVDQYRRAAVYVDRILRGERAGDLPVQAPVKYELVVNLGTARALGLELPSSVLARADEVIE